MVGVPGRSKGCNTCRRRKKGCDLTRPTCNRCSAAGLPCEGYTRDRRFVNSDIKTTMTRSKVSEQIIELQGPLRRESNTTWLKHGDAKTKPDIILSDTLAKTARHQLYIGHLWTTMLPNGECSSTRPSQSSSAPGWAGLISTLYDTESSLRYVTLAMATGCLATQYKDDQLRVKSLQTYNMAVQELGATLKKRNAYQRDGLIVAAGLMASFELVFVPIHEPRVMAWKDHTDGQLGFFLNRGPEAFSSGTAHQLFVDSRINLALLAIGERKVSPFSSHEWKKLPWVTETKSAKDRLMDVMFEVPRLLEQMTSFQSCSCSIMAGIIQDHLVRQCVLLERAMRVWTAKMGTDILRFDYTFVGQPIPGPEREADYALLHLSIVYWFIEMMIFSVKSFASNSSSPEATESARQVKIAAKKSVRALPLLFESSSGLAHNITGLIALSIALRYCLAVDNAGELGEESAMLMDLLDVRLNGSTVGQFLARMNGGRHPLSVQCRDTRGHDPASVIRWF